MSFVRDLIDARLAAWILLVGFGLLAIMHALILVGKVPADFVWGGAVSSTGRLYLLEGVALAMVGLFAWIVARRAGVVGRGAPKLGVRIGAWVVVAYMAFNTIGNLASGAGIERLLFAPATLVLAILALRVAIE